MKVLLAIGVGVVLMVAWFAARPASHPVMQSAETMVGRSKPSPERQPRLPASRLPIAPPTPETTGDSQPTTNVITRLLHGELPRLTAEQVEPFLQKNGRSLESLLGAFDATGHREFLREAVAKYPDDPRVNFAAYFRATEHEAAKPASAESRQRLEAFAKAAPDNALANYLLAFDDFKSGKTDEAVQQLLAAAQKTKFQDYSLEFIQNAEDAYRAAGWSEADAKAVAAYGLALPQLAELKQAGQKIFELAQLYRQNGDATSAQAALNLGVGLGERLAGPGQFSTIHELVGYALQRMFFKEMDPATPVGNTGETVQSRLDAMTQRRAAIKQIVPAVEALLPTLPEADLVSYLDRLKLLGEDAATQWLLRTRGPRPSA